MTAPEISYFNPADLMASLPLLLLVAGGLVLMLLDAFKAARALPIFAALTLLASMLTSYPGWLQAGTQTLHYNGMIYFGGAAALIHLFLCGSGLFSLMFIGDYFKRHHKDLGEVYALMVFAVAGMVMLANGNDLITVFIGLEVMSVCLYIMAGMFKRDKGSNEAGLKYFLLGAFATAFLLYGIALLYGMTGTTRLDEYAKMNMGVMSHHLFFYPAFALLLIGFLFKIAAFPFHSWTPDVYTGTPTPLVGFMATGSKMAAFIALSMLLSKLMPESGGKATTLLAILAVASMLYGNIVAVQQTNLKRMLAFSSIAHTGYLLLGICAGPEGYSAVLFYMVIYTLMTIGAFGIIALVENSAEDSELVSWKGLGLERPWVGVAMSVFLFSLAGIPPLAGFMGKYQVFLSAVNADLVWLAVIGILTSVIGAWYYIRVIVYMYFFKTEENTVQPLSGQSWPIAGALVLVALLLLLGIYPHLVMSLVDNLYMNLGAAAQAVVR